jgi:hypothetical protein
LNIPRLYNARILCFFLNAVIYNIITLCMFLESASCKYHHDMPCVWNIKEKCHTNPLCLNVVKFWTTCFSKYYKNDITSITLHRHSRLGSFLRNPMYTFRIYIYWYTVNSLGYRYNKHTTLSKCSLTMYIWYVVCKDCLVIISECVC